VNSRKEKGRESIATTKKEKRGEERDAWGGGRRGEKVSGPSFGGRVEAFASAEASSRNSLQGKTEPGRGRRERRGGVNGFPIVFITASGVQLKRAQDGKKGKGKTQESLLKEEKKEKKPEKRNSDMHRFKGPNRA